MDHGSAIVGPLHQPDGSGASRSYAFVFEKTNGVAERFNRTLKEQIIHGRIYRNIAELRDAVRDCRRTLQCPVDRRKERLC